MKVKGGDVHAMLGETIPLCATLSNADIKVVSASGCLSQMIFFGEFPFAAFMLSSAREPLGRGVGVPFCLVTFFLGS
ncbi:hypothetical protein [Methylotenera sp.]|uniref:hypothetical protein n=1 Tax=Methylotenera sp. TaxID=2051956 RepID=UPI002487B63E|nr:hypothetical protein [Methylotenera sp.]MDI1299464.1 hypothetical protein [Methylotenera sp.]